MKVLKPILLILLFFHGHARGQKSKEVYSSPQLVIIQISPNAFKHISYKQTDDFGNVHCNGVIVRNNNEAIIFDTPTNDQSSVELIEWVQGKLQCKITAVIPTHFHDDCLGGLKAFHDNNIPSYAHSETIELAKINKLTVPINSFKESIILHVGDEEITATFFGQGHTKDNVVCYFPSEKVMFGGCLIKELKASKGYLGDANVGAWSNTVLKVKAQYPDVKVVVPGHGKHGNIKLLYYTISLFRK